jgi:hypothetical protein
MELKPYNLPPTEEEILCLGCKTEKWVVGQEFEILVGSASNTNFNKRATTIVNNKDTVMKNKVSIKEKIGYGLETQQLILVERRRNFFVHILIPTF